MYSSRLNISNFSNQPPMVMVTSADYTMISYRFKSEAHSATEIGANGLHDPHKIRRLVAYVVLLGGTLNACFGIFAPFLPLEMEKKGFAPDSMGAIIGIYSFSYLFACFSAADMVKRMKRRHFMVLNLLLLCATMLSFGCLVLVQVPESVFVTLALFFRILQGLTAGYLNTIRLSLIGKLIPPQQQAQVFSLSQVSLGLGVTLGPVVGGYLYRSFGYTAPFVLIAAILVTIAFLTNVLVPKQADAKETPAEISYSVSMMNELKQRSTFKCYKELFSHNRIIFFYLINFLCNF